MFRQNKLRVNRSASHDSRVGTHCLLEPLERRRLCSNTPILVTRADDSSVAPVSGMLRYAIVTANNTPGADTIVFNIGGINSGAHSITPIAPLPAITDTLFIDGWSQGGNAYAGPPQIRLDGASAGSGNTVGLRFQDVANCTTRGLSITGRRFNTMTVVAVT